MIGHSLGRMQLVTDCTVCVLAEHFLGRLLATELGQGELPIHAAANGLHHVPNHGSIHSPGQCYTPA